MTASLRWPLHPRPVPGEALSSWLTRIATAHRVRLNELLADNLGSYSFDIYDRTTGGLDIDPPTSLLTAISDRTGRSLDELLSMTIAGRVPCLLNSLEESADPTAFDTYVHQHQILVTHRTRSPRSVTEWRAWLPAIPVSRACPICADDHDTGSAQTLLSSLPLTLSCPRHGCYLERAYGPLGASVIWMIDKPEPRPAPPMVLAMDQRTNDAFLVGVVALPRRKVHAGVWFRLLRTLLDELQTPLSHVPRHSRILRCVWSTLELPPRGGQSVWRPYEQLDWPLQQQLLQAAATAIAMIENDTIRPAGTHAALLRPAPEHTAGDRRVQPGRAKRAHLESGTPPNYWKAAVDSFNKVIVLARTDPNTAETLFQLLANGSALAADVHRMLADVEITDYPSSRNLISAVHDT